MAVIDELLAQGPLELQGIVKLLSLSEQAEIDALFKKAYSVKEMYVGRKVHYRGIIEFSNICHKNCFYCGIRLDNKEIERYRMTEEEIISSAMFAHESGYGSIVLQSGERQDESFVSFVTDILNKIKEVTNGELGVTLSLGEQTKEVYKKWYDAGAHRYLLRIESSNPELYCALHPDDHDFEARVRSLQDLRSVGYQVGTGVMIGLPGQSLEDLANDILFLRDIDVDMIGMGPFIPHHATPMGDSIPDFESKKEEQILLSLKVIAITRILLRDVNIASTTALQALDKIGRERGLQAGANIIMPNISETKYREGYKLYDDKPCTDENSSMCKGCLEGRISSIGEEIGYNEWGDSRHYKFRTGAIKEL